MLFRLQNSFIFFMLGDKHLQFTKINKLKNKTINCTKCHNVEKINIKSFKINK